ncbi:hypothetical protein [Proteiniclasticum sp. QWL-01]|nr:hypothetical protein [Proteiniclasticum sp. QWL-01]WFF72924.1 hypothetical protein P6M73_00185 [Proteiniclasticum sp. QWL-01]
MSLEDASGFDETLVTSARHKEALMQAQQALMDAVAAIELAVPMDLVTIDVHAAWSSLGEITGDTLQEDLVDKIFSGFCIGK